MSEKCRKNIPCSFSKTPNITHIDHASIFCSLDKLIMIEKMKIKSVLMDASSLKIQENLEFFEVIYLFSLVVNKFLAVRQAPLFSYYFLVYSPVPFKWYLTYLTIRIETFVRCKLSSMMERVSWLDSHTIRMLGIIG